MLLAAVTAFTFNMLNKPQKSTSTTPTAPIENTVQPGAPAKQSNAVTPAAEPESQFLTEKTTDALPQENSDGPSSIDEILTGSLPIKKPTQLSPQLSPNPARQQVNVKCLRPN